LSADLLGIGDLIVDMYQDLWNVQPERSDLGEQLFLNAAAAWNVGIMATSSRKMFNLQKGSTWARVAAWSEWVAVSCSSLIKSFIDYQQKAPQPTPSTPFADPAEDGSMKVAKTLVTLAGKASQSSDELWLRLQISLSARDPEGALKLARDGGQAGSLGRLWWRMEGVKVALGRIENVEVVKTGWQDEKDWVCGLLQGDTDA
jgi:N-terminal acetyltransferase B complex non-catalytic subunit